MVTSLSNPFKVIREKLREQKLNKCFETVSIFATPLAMLVDNGDELGFVKIMMSDPITPETELRFLFDSQLQGFLRRHEYRDLVAHTEAGIKRIPRGLLEKLPCREEPFS